MAFLRNEFPQPSKITESYIRESKKTKPGRD